VSPWRWNAGACVSSVEKALMCQGSIRPTVHAAGDRMPAARKAHPCLGYSGVGVEGAGRLAAVVPYGWRRCSRTAGGGAPVRLAAVLP